MNIRLPAFLFAAALAASLLPGVARAEDPLFASSEQIQLTIRAPFPSLFRNRGSDQFVPGTLTDPSGQALPVSLKLRGITRRTSEVCDFPPVRIDFTAPPPATSIFAGQKRLKLVTHCKNSSGFQQKVLLEYAAYRMYNVLTPRSFRVRPASINYQDADGRPMLTRVGFFIEDLKDVAPRNGTVQTHAPPLIPATYLSPPDAARYALFQHLIANHDWSMRAGPQGEDCCHNAELIGPLGPGTVIPIPYDFDFSGLVNAPYATPPDVLRITSVRQRKYRGYCAHNSEALAAARQMRDMRPQMIAALSSVPGLEPKTQQEAISYLDGIFSSLGSDADVQAKILKGCVG
jgi:hypothetical protein